MRVRCPRCATEIEAQPGRLASCPACGFAARVGTSPAPPPGPSAPARVPPPAPDPGAWSDYEPIPTEQDRVEGLARLDEPGPASLTRGRIAAGLVLNLVLPGVGTLLARRRLEGWLQLLTFLAGLATIVWLVGFALMAGAWVWALVGSIQHLVHVGRERATAASS